MTVYDAAVKMNVGISTILTKVIVGGGNTISNNRQYYLYTKNKVM